MKVIRILASIFLLMIFTVLAEPNYPVDGLTDVSISPLLNVTVSHEGYTNVSFYQYYTIPYFVANLTATSGNIYAVAYDEDHIYTAGSDSKVQVYSKENLSLLLELDHSENTVRALYAETGYLYSGGIDHDVHVYYTENMSLKQSLSPNVGSVYSIHCDDEYLYVAGFDSDIRVYWKENLTIATTLDNAETNLVAVYSDSQYIYAGGADTEVQVYNRSDLSLVANLTNPGNTIRSLYSDSSNVYVGEYERLYIYHRNLTFRTTINQIENNIYALSTDEDYLYTAGTDGLIRTYNLTDFTPVFNLSIAGGELYSLAVDADRIYAAGQQFGQVYLKRNLLENFSILGPSDVTYEWTGLHYDTTYSWYVDVDGNVSEVWNFTTMSDTTPPAIFWNWTDLNSTITENSTNPGIVADEEVNCTLDFNGTIYINVSKGTVHEWTVQLEDGNYSDVYVNCEDLYGNSAKSSMAWVYYDSCVPLLSNTSWSDWINVSVCYENDTMRQERNRTEYDEHFCGEVENRTYIEYRWIECDYCTPNMTNSSWSTWYNISGCYENDTKTQERNLTMYDSNRCGEVENMTYTETRKVLCNNATPSISWNWSDINSTLAWDYTRVCIHANEGVNCSLDMNGTNYNHDNVSDHICWQISDIKNGNHSVDATCHDSFGVDASLLDAWLKVNRTFVVNLRKSANVSHVYSGDKINWTISINNTSGGTVNLTINDSNGFDRVSGDLPILGTYNLSYVTTAECLDINNTVSAFDSYLNRTVNSSFLVAVEHCGDGTCNCEEDYKNCAQDCDKPSGGGGGSFQPPETVNESINETFNETFVSFDEIFGETNLSSCRSEWICSRWGVCQDGIRTRDCICNCTDGNCTGNATTIVACSLHLNISLDDPKVGDKIDFQVLDEYNNTVDADVMLVYENGSRRSVESGFVLERAGKFRLEVEGQSTNKSFQAVEDMTEKVYEQEVMPEKIRGALVAVVLIIAGLLHHLSGRKH